MAARAFKIRAEVVEERRQEIGLSMEKLAHRIPIDAKTLNRWMRGGSAYISNVNALAEALDLPPSKLVDGAYQYNSKRGGLFDLRIRVVGSVRSREDIEKLSALTQSLVRDLHNAGIDVVSSSNDLLLADDARLIVEIKGNRHNSPAAGSMEPMPFWGYYLVHPDAYELLIEGAAMNHVSGITEPYASRFIGDSRTSPPQAVVDVVENFRP